MATSNNRMLVHLGPVEILDDTYCRQKTKHRSPT